MCVLILKQVWIAFACKSVCLASLIFCRGGELSGREVVGGQGMDRQGAVDQLLCFGVTSQERKGLCNMTGIIHVCGREGGR